MFLIFGNYFFVMCSTEHFFIMQLTCYESAWLPPCTCGGKSSLWQLIVYILLSPITGRLHLKYIKKILFKFDFFFSRNYNEQRGGGIHPWECVKGNK